jgi:hypothetical protein
VFVPPKKMWQSIGVSAANTEQASEAANRQVAESVFIGSPELARLWQKFRGVASKQRYFAGERRSAGGLPESLERWIRRMATANGEQIIGCAREPLVIVQGERRLRVRWMEEAVSGGVEIGGADAAANGGVAGAESGAPGSGFANGLAVSETVVNGATTVHGTLAPAWTASARFSLAARWI